MTENEIVISHTTKWITEVVIGCNFCPFAAKEIRQNRVYFEVEVKTDLSECLQSFLNECIRLDENKDIETLLLIFPRSFQNFHDYLHLVEKSEKLLLKKGYEGIYQVASFHPDYYFGDSTTNDPANFTNRSPYPMLHILREESIDLALVKYPHPEQIPENNIKFTREKGYTYMEMLRDACLGISEK